MIKIIRDYGKVNFVDTKNNLVGFSNDSICCEEVGYLVDGKHYSNDIIHANIKGFKEIKKEIMSDFDKIKLEANCVDITLTNGQVITIYNIQNGYYWHTVELGINEKEFEVLI